MGIESLDKVRAELFNNLNKRKKVSVNLLRDEDVREWPIDGKTLLVVEIPRARRQQRPVYLTGNPLGGNTYLTLQALAELLCRKPVLLRNGYLSPMVRGAEP